MLHYVHAIMLPDVRDEPARFRNFVATVEDALGRLGLEECVLVPNASPDHPMGFVLIDCSSLEELREVLQLQLAPTYAPHAKVLNCKTPRVGNVITKKVLSQNYPRLFQHMHSALDRAEVTDLVADWRRNGMNFPDWFAPYYRESCDKEYCMKLNHKRALGCRSVSTCSRVHRCALCHQEGHGAFSYDCPDRRLMTFSVHELQRLGFDILCWEDIVDSDFSSCGHFQKISPEELQAVPAASLASGSNGSSSTLVGSWHPGGSPVGNGQLPRSSAPSSITSAPPALRTPAASDLGSRGSHDLRHPPRSGGAPGSPLTTPASSGSSVDMFGHSSPLRSSRLSGASQVLSEGSRSQSQGQSLTSQSSLWDQPSAASTRSHTSSLAWGGTPLTDDGPPSMVPLDMEDTKSSTSGWSSGLHRPGEDAQSTSGFGYALGNRAGDSLAHLVDDGPPPMLPLGLDEPSSDSNDAGPPSMVPLEDDIAADAGTSQPKPQGSSSRRTGGVASRSEGQPNRPPGIASSSSGAKTSAGGPAALVPLGEDGASDAASTASRDWRADGVYSTAAHSSPEPAMSPGGTMGLGMGGPSRAMYPLNMGNMYPLNMGGMGGMGGMGSMGGMVSMGGMGDMSRMGGMMSIPGYAPLMFQDNIEQLAASLAGVSLIALADWAATRRKVLALQKDMMELAMQLREEQPAAMGALEELKRARHSSASMLEFVQKVILPLAVDPAAVVGDLDPQTLREYNYTQFCERVGPCKVGPYRRMMEVLRRVMDPQVALDQVVRGLSARDNQLGTSSVREWLQRQGFGDEDTADLFEQHDVDAVVLPWLTMADLDAIGIKKAERRKALLWELRQWNSSV
ncbi:uncharacterized protein MONBRDRAFT_25813 [Monosiga brevicollis MX1]|uniref:SAM domain-containing protein n=1 Tax=Monosiga brevicollis TaxID=81824 RepID=A9V0I2_MONBE|nr:uncharacterized protein MONBRDRAFT_25813 [Monosiga brevicollis MX1]EDQ89018.1 predicted protein [Monosiga brevicollis MX1]|eukprot:XP_001746123.1 hypothetical protein [Monosiga brevicollis MX1]